MVAWVEGRREQARATNRARDRQDCIWGDWLAHFYIREDLLAHLRRLGGLGSTSQTSGETGQHISDIWGSGSDIWGDQLADLRHLYLWGLANTSQTYGETSQPISDIWGTGQHISDIGGTDMGGTGQHILYILKDWLANLIHLQRLASTSQKSGRTSQHISEFWGTGQHISEIWGDFLSHLRHLGRLVSPFQTYGETGEHISKVREDQLAHLRILVGLAGTFQNLGETFRRLVSPFQTSGQIPSTSGIIYLGAGGVCEE